MNHTNLFDYFMLISGRTFCNVYQVYSSRVQAILYIITDGPKIEDEKEQKSMATLLRRTGITKYAPYFSDMLFMAIDQGDFKTF